MLNAGVAGRATPDPGFKRSPPPRKDRPRWATSEQLPCFQGRRAGLARRLQAEVAPRLGARHAPARGTDQIALLDQVGLDHVLEGAALFAQGGSERIHADRAAIEVLDDQAQQAP